MENYYKSQYTDDNSYENVESGVIVYFHTHDKYCETVTALPILSPQSTVTCNDVKDNDTLVKCDHIGNPLRTGKGVYFNMLLDIPREMAESEEMYTFISWVNT